MRKKKIKRVEKPIEIQNIISVYSGKPGCCCGCLGKHTYHPDYRVTAGVRRGYKVEKDEVNLSTVKRVVRILNKNLKEVADEGGHYFFEDFSKSPTGRWYIAYKY